MGLIHRVLDGFCDHAVVFNDDEVVLAKEVEIVQKQCGPWCRVKGYTDFWRLFFDIHLSKSKNHPVSTAFFPEAPPTAGELVLKRVVPDIKTIHYSNPMSPQH